MNKTLTQLNLLEMAIGVCMGKVAVAAFGGGVRKQAVVSGLHKQWKSVEIDAAGSKHPAMCVQCVCV